MSLQLVPVNVCGQQLQASFTRGAEPPSLQVLKETVERGVGMQQDWIQFFDNNGTKLLTDEEVSAAINDGRAPIHATISDHSVHNFEQRREEFAHMQWKVMRDQVTVLNLQLAHQQEQLKAMRGEVAVRDQDTTRALTTMKNQLEDGLQIVSDCKTCTSYTEQMLKNLDDNVHSMGLKLNQETMKRDTCMQDVQFKMDRLNTAQQHETARLAEAFDSCLNLLQEADGQLGQDLRALEQKVEATRELANQNQAEALKQVAEARAVANRTIGDANTAVLKQAHDDAEKQVNELMNSVAKFETRIVKSESLASDTANRWLASHDQLKQQYNTISQAVEQCRLQGRTTAASCQEVRDKLGIHGENLQAQSTALKQLQERERKDRTDQIKSVQQALDGTLKSTCGELEVRLSNRVEQEADHRASSIRQVLDDIGTVLEKEIPSKLRMEPKKTKMYEVQAPTTMYTVQTPRGPTAGYPMLTGSVYNGSNLMASPRRANPSSVPAFPTTVMG